MAEWMPIRLMPVIAGALLLLAPFARAQPADAGPTGEIDVSAEFFGAGGVARRGEHVGIRLVLTDSYDRPRDVLVRVPLRDGDGDRALYERVVATNPGVRQPVWLYFQLPIGFDTSDLLNVMVFSASESGAGDDPALARYSAGRLLGQARIGARGLLYAREGAYGIVGRKALGLSPYEGNLGSTQRNDHPTGHERSELVPLDPGTMPDRWLGLAQFDVIAWGEGQPGQLTPELAHSVREWVRRGGHLVVVIPRVGQTWMDETSNPLHDITPHVRLERRENTPLVAENLNVATRPPPEASRFDELLYRFPVTPRRAVPPDAIHVFKPLTGADWGDAIPIINARGPTGDADGGCIVVRRLEGAGAVTLIGLDLTARALDTQGLPQADVFWHRILGRREPLPTEVEAGLTDRTGDSPRNPVQLASPSRDRYTIDRDFAGQIDRTGSAAAGVLLGFVVFVLYWLVAGPVGFFVLRRLGYERHAWAAFLGAAGLFTAVAWGGATAIRPARTEGTHLTLLDHVYGQPWQRTRTWLNLLVPAYGDATIRAGDPAEDEGVLDPAQRFHHAVTPWSPEAAGGGFPDARGYAIESKSPAAVRFPTRSTVKLFQIDWAGGPRWQMPTPEPGPDGTEGVVRLVPREEEGDGRPIVRGVLKHKLPGVLQDVTLVVVRRQRELNPSLIRPQSPVLLADIVAVSRPTWAPGEAWDLSMELQTGSESGVRLRAEDWLGDRLAREVGVDDNSASPDMGRLVNRLKSLTFFTQLEPPKLVSQADDRLIARQFTHGWDLGRWFTQPCVIIVGVLGSAAEGESPTPIQMNTGGGYRPLSTRGRTLVRWVYPLPADPPAWLKPESEQPPAEGAGEGGGG